MQWEKILANHISDKRLACGIYREPLKLFTHSAIILVAPQPLVTTFYLLSL